MSDDQYPDPAEPRPRENLSELFPYELPFRVSAIAGALIVTLFFTVLIGAIVVEVPETVAVPFVLEPVEGSEPIVAVRAGILHAVHVKESDRVQEGAPLFVIRSDQVRVWTTELATLEQDLIALDDRKGVTQLIHQTRLEERQGEIQKHETTVRFRRSYLSTYEDILTRMRKSESQGLSRLLDVLQHELGFAEARRDVDLAELSAETARRDFEILDVQRSAEIYQEDIDQKKLVSRIRSLETLLEDVEGDMLIIRAPYDGAVTTVVGAREGDPIRSGQELCQIAPLDATPRARIRIPETAIPKAKEGRPAKLYFDAFPYQRYGTISGHISHTSASAVQTEEGPVFVGLIDLDRYAFNDRDGESPVLIGMAGEARISVGRRTLIEYAFEPIRKLRENFRPADAQASKTDPTSDEQTVESQPMQEGEN